MNFKLLSFLGHPNGGLARQYVLVGRMSPTFGGIEKRMF